MTLIDREQLIKQINNGQLDPYGCQYPSVLPTKKQTQYGGTGLSQCGIH
jgi:hypothetical protein